LLRRIARGFVYGAVFGALIGLLGGVAILLLQMYRHRISYIGLEVSLLVGTTPLGAVLGAVIGAVRGCWR
jgi:hypothetical protein